MRKIHRIDHANRAAVTIIVVSGVYGRHYSVISVIVLWRTIALLRGLLV